VLEHCISKRRQQSWKYDAQWSIFNELRGVWKSGQTLSWMFNISFQSKLKISRKWRNKIVKINTKSIPRSSNLGSDRIGDINLAYGDNILTAKKKKNGLFSFTLATNHFRTLGIGLELACKWGFCGKSCQTQMTLISNLMIFPSVSLYCKLVPVQCREYKYGLFRNLSYFLLLHISPSPAYIPTQRQTPSKHFPSLALQVGLSEEHFVGGPRRSK